MVKFAVTVPSGSRSEMAANSEKRERIGAISRENSTVVLMEFSIVCAIFRQNFHPGIYLQFCKEVCLR